MFLCFSLQGAVRLMRASLSVITSRIPMMTLTGRTSTHRKCRTSHQTSHKVRFEFLSSVFIIHLTLGKVEKCIYSHSVLIFGIII